ncbi:MAG: SusC/RagA family TonB-linked outer membrane protein [Prevotellaceae bacterium]|jgi:TonB-linked SusC/RagA family outer membrane protein|nr:SusC/RagA family TonB-linked outer membrane protein [Prevotellaceae bacterium]
MKNKLALQAKFWLFACACTVSLSAQAQDFKITGQVLDSQNRPVAGASVAVKGSSAGAIADADGSYSISASAGSTLLFSFVGMERKEELVNGRSRIDVVLSDEEQQINEVVVMGYNSKTKSELSSSVVTLSSEKLTDVTSSNVASMLQGKAAGVMVSSATGAPGATPEILIRGAGSITAQATPLYVVDGIIGGTYNPNDVETLTVLKDAAATSLYGSSAAGGVIIITTKHAKYGQKTVVDFKSTFGRKTADNGHFALMNAESLFAFQKAAMSPALFEVNRPVKLKRQNFDWIDAAFSPGYVQNYYLSVAGGAPNVAYRISGDYYDEDGTLLSTSYKRLNIRSNVSAKLTERLTLKTDITYTHSRNNNYLWYTLEDAYKNMPWDNPYDENGEAVFINSNQRPDGAMWYGNRKMNFLHSNEYNYDSFTGNSIMGDLTLTWNILDWLSFESRNRAATDNGFQKTFIDPRTFDIEWKDRGTNTEYSTINYSVGTTNLLSAKKAFGLHALDGFVGFESGYWSNRYTSATAIDLPLVGLPSLSIGNPHQVGGSLVEGSGISYLGQLQYSYDGRYIASASVRTDAASTFGPDNRWGTFPAGSLAWLASRESFLKGNAVVTFLKVRGSFGVTGNSNIGQYRYLSSYSFTSRYNDVTGALPVNLPNSMLGWESAWMSNAGVDVALLKRITLNVDLYSIDNKDLLLNVPVSASSGYEYKLQNIGSVRNRGVEVQVSSENIKGDFTWTTDFNIAFNRNAVMSIPNAKPFTQSAGGSTMLNQIVEEGEDIFTWYMPKWLGVDPATGSPMWERTKDDSGNPIAPEVTNDYAKATPQKVGKASPLFTGGLMNTFAYKGFALSVTCNFLYKNLIYNYGRESFDIDGASLDINQMELAEGWSRWEKPGDNATHPKPMTNGNSNAHKTSSRYLEDGSYFRIRNVTLSYAFPKKWMEKVKISNLRIYVSADNLYTYTEYSGMDPEVSYQMAAWSLPGMQAFKYPLSKQFLGGIELTF